MRQMRARFGGAAALATALLLALVPMQGRSSVNPMPPDGAYEGASNGPSNGALNKAIVRFSGSLSKIERASAMRKAGVRVVRDLMVAGYSLVEFDAPVAGTLKALRAVPGVLYAERNYELRVQAGLPNDPCNNLSRDQRCPYTAWHLAATSAAPAWARYPGQYFSPSNPKSNLPASKRILVAVVDVPIMRDNADFKNGNSSDDRAFGGQLDVAGIVGFPSNVRPEFGGFYYHGTYVAGLLAATANNSFASAGLGYAADLLPISAVHADGRAEADVVGDAIVYANSRGARVITLALGLTEPSSYVNAAIQQVVSSPNPPLVIAAAGNNTGDAPFYPAWFDNVMAIGGTDEADEKASCANFGSKISVSAPAKRVQSLSQEASVPMVDPECGTSAAAPQVAGLAALLFSQDPSRTPEQVRFIIEQTADDIGVPGRDDFFGYGRINADRALSYGLDLPQADGITTTPARAGGSTGILATARSGSPVVAAEMFVGRPPSSAAERGFPMAPVDGAFDSFSEQVSAAYSVSGMQSGGHRIYVRVLDESGSWGPLSTAAFVVDSFAPVIDSLAASDSVRLAGPGSTISFNMTDETSKRLSFSIEARSMLGSTTAVWRWDEPDAAAGRQSVLWEPEATVLPGRYAIKVTVRDRAGNAASATTSMLLV